MQAVNETNLSVGISFFPACLTAHVFYSVLPYTLSNFTSMLAFSISSCAFFLLFECLVFQQHFTFYFLPTRPISISLQCFFFFHFFLWALFQALWRLESCCELSRQRFSQEGVVQRMPR